MPCNFLKQTTRSSMQTSQGQEFGDLIYITRMDSIMQVHILLPIQHMNNIQGLLPSFTDKYNVRHIRTKKINQLNTSRISTQAWNKKIAPANPRPGSHILYDDKNIKPTNLRLVFLKNIARPTEKECKSRHVASKVLSTKKLRNFHLQILWSRKQGTQGCHNSTYLEH